MSNIYELGEWNIWAFFKYFIKNNLKWDENAMNRGIFTQIHKT